MLSFNYVQISQCILPDKPSKKYTKINELSSKIVQEFIQNTTIHYKVKIDGVKTQQADIYYNGVGHIEI